VSDRGLHSLTAPPVPPTGEAVPQPPRRPTTRRQATPRPPLSTLATNPPLNPNSACAAAINGANPPRSRRTRRQSPSHSRTTPSHHLTGDGPGRGGRRSRAHDGSGRVSVYKLLHTSRSNKLNKSKMLAH
jgi:hypothetical protein